MRRTLAHCCLAAGLMTAAGPTSADCRALFPTERVQEKLADTRYQHCDAVAQDYADFLAEQGVLLAALRPAYMRKLGLADAETGDEQSRKRLQQYDNNLSKLRLAAAAVRKVPPAAASEASAAAAGSSSGSRSAVRLRLKECRALSQALSDRIAVGVDEFHPEEVTIYCKQDFLFRVSAALHTRLSLCLQGD